MGVVRLYQYRTKKPEYNVPVNHAHPIARDLEYAIFPNENTGLPINVTGNTSPTTGSPSAVYSIDGYGRFYKLDTTGSNGLDFINPNTGAEKRTVILCHRTVASQIDNALFEQGTNTTGNRTTFKYTTAGALRFEIEGSGHTSSLTPTANGLNISGFRVTGSTSVDLFLNNQFEATSGLGTINTTGTACGFLYPAAGGGAAVATTDNLYWALYFKRDLTDDEIGEVTDNAFQLLRPLISYQIIGAGAGVGGSELEKLLMGSGIMRGITRGINRGRL